MKTIKLSLILCLVTVLLTSCRVLYDSDFISYYSVSDRYPEGYIIVEQESGVLIFPASTVRDYFFAYYQDDFASLDEYLLCLLNNPNAFDFAKHIYSPSSSTNIKRTISRKKLSRKGLCLLEETEYGYMAKLGLTKEQYLTILKKCLIWDM
ncbi:MAG: hypothetical protein MJZ07_02735 [Bacteroidales bacterium]|nr:hypothetical protein [Bacteroidales bacterium]